MHLLYARIPRTLTGGAVLVLGILANDFGASDPLRVEIYTLSGGKPQRRKDVQIGPIIVSQGLVLEQEGQTDGEVRYHPVEVLLRAHSQLGTQTVRGEARIHYKDGHMQAWQSSGIFEDMATSEMERLCMNAHPVFVLSKTWSGPHIMLSLDEGKKRVTGWETRDNELWTKGVRGAPCTVHAATAIIDLHQPHLSVGYVVWGGNAGLRVGGEAGYGLPMLFFGTAEELPQHVREAVHQPPTEANKSA